MNLINKLEGLSLAILFKSMIMIAGKASEIKHLSGDPFLGRQVALPANIRLDRTGLPGTNTLAYFKNS